MKRPFLGGGMSSQEARALRRDYRRTHPPKPDKSTRGFNAGFLILAILLALLIRGCVWLAQ